MFICPNCGEPVRDDASACPHCGSDDETGWNPDGDYLSVDIPDDEPAPHERPRGASTAFALFLVAVGLLGVAALGGVRALASASALLAGLGVVALVLSRIGKRAR